MKGKIQDKPGFDSDNCWMDCAHCLESLNHNQTRYRCRVTGCQEHVCGAHQQQHLWEHLSTNVNTKK